MTARLELEPGTRVTLGAGASRAICSLATDGFIGLLEQTSRTFADYAERWGWDLVLSTQPELGCGRHPSWAKLQLIRELLDRYELVLWADADVVVVDGSADILDVLVPGKDLYLTELGKGKSRWILSAGLFLIRSSEWSRDFVDRLWSCEHLADHRWNENAALLELLGYDIQTLGRVRPSPDLDRVQIIDIAWNSCGRVPSPAPYIKHYPGAGRYEDRRAELMADLRGLLARQTAAASGDIREREFRTA